MTWGQTSAVRLAWKAPVGPVCTVTSLPVAHGCCGAIQLVREHSTTCSFASGRNAVPERWVVVFTIRLLGFATMCGAVAAAGAAR